MCWCYDVKIQDSDAEDDDHDDDYYYYYYDDGDGDDDDDDDGDDDDGDDDCDDDDEEEKEKTTEEEEDEDDSIQKLYGRYAAGLMMTIDDVFATGDHCISLRLIMFWKPPARIEVIQDWSPKNMFKSLE